MSSHPTYPNPTLTEVVCELRFPSSKDRPWSPQILRDFHKRIRAEYPSVERAVEVRVTGSPVPAELRQARERATYQHEDDARQLKLAEGTFSIHVVGLGRYQNWAWFRDYVLESWSRLREELRVSKVERVGLRYVNRVERRALAEAPSRWLVQTDYVPGAVLKSAGRFLSRVECRNDDENATIVTIGINQQSLDEPGALIFDIDRIRDETVAPDGDKMLAVADDLHEDVWEVFREALTKEYLGILEEVPEVVE